MPNPRVAPTLAVSLLLILPAARAAVPDFPPDLPLGTYSSEDAFPGLTFADPVAIVTPPGESNRLFIVEQVGRIIVIPDLSTPAKETFLDIRSRVRDSGNEEGLFGLAFHPDYNNSETSGFGQFFVCYMTTLSGSRYWRVSRFTVNGSDPNRGDSGSELPLITQRDRNSNHNAGDLAFGADGYLYISAGDEGGANDYRDNAQHIDKNFFGAILRIDIDQDPANLAPNAHSAVHSGTYKVPADNPFVGATSFNGSAVTPANVRTEIWAIGMRNPWRMSFDVPTGRLFVADVGQDAYEEINVLSPTVFAANGGIPNYGWSYREGFHPFTSGPGGATPPSGFTHIDPIHEYPHNSGARSVSGGLVYRGAQYPELAGDYLFADYLTGTIWALDDPGGPAQSVSALANDTQIAGFGINPLTGEILLADNDSDRNQDDRIKRLVRTSGTVELPQFLSETGIFSDLATLTPEPDVQAYDLNVPFWSDKAIKRRWYFLPGGGAQMTWSEDGNWSFPEGQVWVKHFDLDLDRDQPGTNRRRLETRVVVKTDDDAYGITYRWNPAQTDAELLGEDGATEDFTITEGGQQFTQTWTYPSRTDCRTCHTPAGGFALGFNTRQLNRDFDFGGSLVENQITHMENAGSFSNDPPDPSTLPVFHAADDGSASIADRARSFLAVNCVQCHQPGGPSQGDWDARPEIALPAAAIIDGELVNNAGDPLNRVLAPGSPGHSMLVSRLASVGSGSALSSMPPLATGIVNQDAIDLLTVWAEEENAAPTAEAGTDSVVLLPADASLAGTASDDGYPAPTNLSVEWSKHSGPGTVTFSDASAVTTGATFSQDGLYQLRLTVEDGAKTTTSDLTVEVGQSRTYWKESVFSPAQLADPDISGDFADYEKDGLTTIEEYVHGTNPLLADTAPVGWSVLDDRLTCDFLVRKHTDGVTVTPFVGDTPETGDSGPVHLDEEVLSDDGVWVELRARDKTRVSEAPKRFLWLRFETP